MASVPALTPTDTLVHQLGRAIVETIVAVGDLALFGGQVVRQILNGLPRRGVVTLSFYEVGVRSIPVVAVTGLFIGMVLAVQAYDQFHFLHMESKLGAAINASLVRELGPTLAATMLAGRVGSAMAAELGTMRVTEQIDALKALGANPIQYLVVPRFLACFLLIPLLTAIADAVGIFGGWMIGTQVLKIDSFYWWLHSKLRCRMRSDEELLLRWSDRTRLLLSGLSLRSRGRRRRPGVDTLVRLVLRGDPGAGFLSGSLSVLAVLLLVARSHLVVLSDVAGLPRMTNDQ